MPQTDHSVADATPTEAFTALGTDPSARIVDVRTRPEWMFTGLADLSDAGSEPVLIEWQAYPSMQVATGFGAALEQACPDKAAPLYFLCRSGARSLAAARVAKTLGYQIVFNVTDGFEGPPDAEGHRGTVAGWKASGLPWRQT